MKSIVLSLLVLAFVLPSQAGIVKQSYKHGVKPAAKASGKAAVRSVKFLKRVIF